MKMQSWIAGFCLLWMVGCTSGAYNLGEYGLVPDSGEDSSPLFIKALQTIQKEYKGTGPVVIILPPGRYDFYPEKAEVREFFISNHDQDNPKRVGIPLEGIKNIVFDGQGAELIFHGRMLPLSLINTENCTFRNFSIDFETPHICQIKVLENDTTAGSITFETAPWVNYTIRDSVFNHIGHNWELPLTSGIAFEEQTRRLVYRTSDIRVGTRQVKELSPGIIKSYDWKNSRLIPGTVIALRSWARPAPGIFMYHCKNTLFENVKIHYAEGMGLLAQMSENITLDGFSVCLRGEKDPRYFTTQADATHFSGCKGKIISINGLYEGMMDDAINVHGTYLKMTEKVDDYTLKGRYMHGQSYGFEWGTPDDEIQFIRSRTMELTGRNNRIKTIEAIDQPDDHGAKEFLITFKEKLHPDILAENSIGLENLEWTPEVIFNHNMVRNNRARGTLFSTPKPTRVENNLFDHTSGSAILLCGDCNGWYETGACKDVVIRNNRFINSLTNLFQFTNAVISIYPEIPELDKQEAYFHSGIVIEDNYFETFDTPILYAKSVDGLIFRNNEVKKNNDYPSFHWNQQPILLERVINTQIDDI